MLIRSYPANGLNSFNLSFPCRILKYIRKYEITFAERRRNYLELCLFDILVLFHLIFHVGNVSQLNYFSFILASWDVLKMSFFSWLPCQSLLVSITVQAMGSPNQASSTPPPLPPPPPRPRSPRPPSLAFQGVPVLHVEGSAKHHGNSLNL